MTSRSQQKFIRRRTAIGRIEHLQFTRGRRERVGFRGQHVDLEPSRQGVDGSASHVRRPRFLRQPTSQMQQGVHLIRRVSNSLHMADQLLGQF